jgi:hypothetical protein
MRVYIFIVLLMTMESCAIFYGCDKDNNLVVLEEGTRLWTPYSQIDEIIFENGSVESLVKVLEFTDSIELYDRGDECAFGTQEVVFTKLISVLFTDTIEVKLSRLNRVEIENTKFQLTYLEGSKIVYPTTNTDKKYENTVAIDQKVFNEVLISKYPNSNTLSEIVFSKSNGLVAFKLNGAYWTKK